MSKAILWLRNFLLLSLLFFLPYTYAMFQGGFVSWFLFFSLLPIWIYLIGLWIYPIHRWHVDRILAREHLQAGDSLKITINVKRKIPFPIFYCMLTEIIPPSLEREDVGFQKYHYLREPEKLHVRRLTKTIVFPWFRRTFHWTYELKNLPRGVHPLTALQIETSDFFGLIRKKHTLSKKDFFYVYPNQWFMEGWLFPTHGKHNIQQGKNWKREENIPVSIRDYAFGDQASWIHWRQTARKNKLMSKEFEQEGNKQTTIIFDQRDRRRSNELLFEGYVELARSFVEYVRKEEEESYFFSLGKTLQIFPLSKRVMNAYEVDTNFLQMESITNPLAKSDLQNVFQEVNEDSQLLLLIHAFTQEKVNQILPKIHLYPDIHLFVIEKGHSLEEEEGIFQLMKRGVRVHRLSAEKMTKEFLEVNVYGDK